MSFPAIYHTTTTPGNSNFPLFNKKVGDFLWHAEEVAQALHNPTSPAGGPSGGTAQHVTNIGKVKIGNSYKGLFFNCFNTSNNTRGNRRSDDEMDPMTRVLIFALSAVVGGYALYKMGQWYHQAREAQEELDDLRRFAKELKPIKNTYPLNSHIQEISQVIDREKQIFLRIKQRSIVNLCITVSVVAAASFAILGALANSIPLVIIGAAIIVISGGGLLLKWGFEHHDRRPGKDAQAIQSAIAILKGATIPEQGVAPIQYPNLQFQFA
jgi:hypothetical protein